MKVRNVLLTTALLLASSAYALDPAGLKTGREIYASYAAITHIKDHDPELRELMRLNADRVPRKGTPEELSNGTILATTELGGAFCKKSLASEKTLPRGQRYLFGDVDFKRGPSQFNDFLKGAMLDHLAVSFWQRNITDDEKTPLSKMIADAVAKGPETPDETVNVLQLVCVSYATSLGFLAK